MTIQRSLATFANSSFRGASHVGRAKSVAREKKGGGGESWVKSVSQQSPDSHQEADYIFSIKSPAREGGGSWTAMMAGCGGSRRKQNDYKTIRGHPGLPQSYLLAEIKQQRDRGGKNLGLGANTCQLCDFLTSLSLTVLTCNMGPKRVTHTVKGNRVGM